jgi:hypothetical protein
MTGWSTVFFDGFNGTQLDWTKWPITYGGSMYWNNAFWWDNGQLGVGNGELTIGMLSSIPRVRRVATSVSAGTTAERRGSRSTSSKVMPVATIFPSMGR